MCRTSQAFDEDMKRFMKEDGADAEGGIDVAWPGMLQVGLVQHFGAKRAIMGMEYDGMGIIIGMLKF